MQARAICASGFSPGIAFLGSCGGYSPSRKVISERDNQGPLFGPGGNDIPANNFFIGKWHSTIQRA